MSNIIPFRADRRTASRTLPADEQPQILLFTGVRYIRDDAEAAPPPPPPCVSLPLPLEDDRLQA